MKFRAALRWALWWGLMGLLAGCGSLPFGDQPQEDKPVEPKRPPQFNLDVNAPPPLRELLAQRVMWSLLNGALLIAVTRRWRELAGVLRSRRQVLPRSARDRAPTSEGGPCP